MSQRDRIDWLERHIWPYIAKMLAAVADGIRSVDPEAQFSTHMSGEGAINPDLALAFYRAMNKGGFHPDELGTSFYPSNNQHQPDLLLLVRETVEQLWRTFARPVFFSEFGYPAALMKEGPFSTWNYQLEKYPLTPKGQAGLLRDLVSWGVTAGLSGIRPWGPDLVVPGWEPMSLFHFDGKTAFARPGIDAVVEGLSTPNQNALQI
jgi:arabinogalactan endo-1,4-beta-galactosidase